MRCHSFHVQHSLLDPLCHISSSSMCHIMSGHAIRVNNETSFSRTAAYRVPQTSKLLGFIQSQEDRELDLVPSSSVATIQNTSFFFPRKNQSIELKESWVASRENTPSILNFEFQCPGKAALFTFQFSS